MHPIKDCAQAFTQAHLSTVNTQGPFCMAPLKSELKIILSYKVFTLISVQYVLAFL